nr:uncharacterized mitochondrial protein AtMg00810-like [Nicotiana tomentosiformis]
MFVVKYLVVIAIKNGWPLFKLDVNNAFLHGGLDEKVYMKLPPGLSVTTTSSSSSFSTLDDLAEITALKTLLNAQFKIKYLGTLHYFLGIEVSSLPGGVLPNQKKFIFDLLREFDCLEVASVVFPLELNSKLKADCGDLLAQPERYRSLVGKLLFLTNTRPDIYFGVLHLSQFLQSPRVPHMAIALHLLRYLKGTPDLGLFYSNSSDFTISAYSDSDWATCPDTMRYVTGFCVFLEPSTRSCSYCQKPVFHEQTKHIEVDYHFVRGKLSNGFIQLSHVSTSKQFPDVLTKPLTGLLHHQFVRKFQRNSCNSCGQLTGTISKGNRCPSVPSIVSLILIVGTCA